MDTDTKLPDMVYLNPDGTWTKAFFGDSYVRTVYIPRPAPVPAASGEVDMLKVRSKIVFELANAGYEDAADYVGGEYILEVMKEAARLSPAVCSGKVENIDKRDGQ